MANACLPVNHGRGKSAAMRRNQKTTLARQRGLRLWGRHAVLAALANPNRTVVKLWATREALAELDLPPVLPIMPSGVVDLAGMVPAGAPHQGLVAEAEPLPDRYLDEFFDRADDDKRPILLLDQVTDPQNVGAVLRSAAAFDAVAIVSQDRHSPPESGDDRARRIGRARKRAVGAGGQSGAQPR